MGVLSTVIVVLVAFFTMVVGILGAVIMCLFGAVVMAFFTVVVAVFVTVIMVVRFVGHALRARQARDGDGVDDGRFVIGSLEHRRHEGVIAAAVDDDHVGLRQLELVLGGGLVIVRILCRIVDDRSHLSCIAGDVLDDVSVDVGGRHNGEVLVAALGGVVGTTAAGQRDKGTSGESRKNRSAERAHRTPFQAEIVDLVGRYSYTST